jgi:hypothetical protein
MQGISSTDTHLVDAAAAAKRFDQLLQQFHGNTEMAHMAMQSESHGMVPFAQLAMEYQRLKKTQPTKPVDQNSIRNQILSQGIATLPQESIGNEDVYHAAYGGLVAFDGTTGSLVGGRGDVGHWGDIGEAPSEDIPISEEATADDYATRAFRNATVNPAEEALAESPYRTRLARELGSLRDFATRTGQTATRGARAVAPLANRLGGWGLRGLEAVASPVAMGVTGLLHSPDTVSNADEMALIQRNRNSRGLGNIYQALPTVNPNATSASSAAPGTPPAGPAAPAAPAVIAGPNGPAAAPSPAAVPRTGILSPANPSAGSNDDPIQKLLLDQITNYHPKTLSERIAEQKAALGTNQGLEDYKKSLDDLGQISKDHAASQTRFAKAAAFFNMAAAAGKPGQAGSGLSKFINAANEGGLSYAAAVPHIQQGLMDMQQKIAVDKFHVADAQRREDAEGLRDATREYNTDERGHMQAIGDLARFRATEYGADQRAKASEYGADRRAEMQYRLSTKQMNAATATENAAYIRSTYASLDSRRKELNLLRSNIIYTSDPIAKQQLDREYNEVTSNLNTLIAAGTQHLGIEGMNNLTGTAPAASTYQEGQTATGRDGKRIVFKNGQWSPLA